MSPERPRRIAVTREKSCHVTPQSHTPPTEYDIRKIAVIDLVHQTTYLVTEKILGILAGL